MKVKKGRLLYRCKNEEKFKKYIEKLNNIRNNTNKYGVKDNIIYENPQNIEGLIDYKPLKLRTMNDVIENMIRKKSMMINPSECKIDHGVYFECPYKILAKNIGIKCMKYLYNNLSRAIFSLITILTWIYLLYKR